MNIDDLNKQQLQALVHRLAWNDGFGCHTRAGFEQMIWPEIVGRARWIVYFDVDGVHALNESFGSYEPVNAMIRQVLSSVRSTDVVAGQLYSGDEFLVCLCDSDERAALDPQGLVDRLTAELAKHNLTAIFAIVPVTSQDLISNVKPAADRVLELKKQRGVTR